MKKTEDGSQKTEVRRLWSEYRRRKTEVRRRKSETSRRKTEDRRRKSEVRRRKTEDGSQKTEVRRRKSEDGSNLNNFKIHYRVHFPRTQLFLNMSEEDNKQAPYEVFEGSAWEAGLLQSILEDNEIETIIQQANSLPWNSLPLKGAAAKVFVALKDYEKARVIVKEFYVNMKKENTNDPRD